MFVPYTYSYLQLVMCIKLVRICVFFCQIYLVLESKFGIVLEKQMFFLALTEYTILTLFQKTKNKKTNVFNDFF